MSNLAIARRANGLFSVIVVWALAVDNTLLLRKICINHY